MKVSKEKIYIKFNKPYGVLSSFSDPEGRTTLQKFIPIANLYAVGRLDMDSEGLMLLTNDGWLNHRITAPESHLQKTYLVQGEGIPTSEKLDQLKAGLLIKNNYKTLPCEVEIIPAPALPERAKPITANAETFWIKIKIIEGKKRQIRHMTAAVGLPTLRLVRIAIGPLLLGSLLVGEWSFLNPVEINLLRVS